MLRLRIAIRAIFTADSSTSRTTPAAGVPLSLINARRSKARAKIADLGKAS